MTNFRKQKRLRFISDYSLVHGDYPDINPVDSAQYDYRMLMSQNTEPVEKEMKELTASYQADKLKFVKNPVMAEFLGLASNVDFTESGLEQRIITHQDVGQMDVYDEFFHRRSSFEKKSKSRRDFIIYKRRN